MNGQHVSKYRVSIGGFILIVLFAGCSSSSNPPSNPPSSLPTGTYYYQVRTSNIRLLDTTTGEYVLWLRFATDTAYTKSIPLTYWTVNHDSIIFQGTVKLIHSADSVVYAALAIEPRTVGNTPSSIVIAGRYSDGMDSLTVANGIGDYANAQVSVIFTTKSGDTSRAKSEFYLMRFSNGVASASASNFHVPPSGWTYSLWVLDSNFYPQHKFFYGSFTDPAGPDSDPSSDEYPFPGGFKTAALNDAGGRIEITVDPTFAVTGNKPAAPSPFVILWTPLQRFLYFNESLPLENVWNSSKPTGLLKLWR